MNKIDKSVPALHRKYCWDKVYNWATTTAHNLHEFGGEARTTTTQHLQIKLNLCGKIAFVSTERTNILLIALLIQLYQKAIKCWVTRKHSLRWFLNLIDNTFSCSWLLSHFKIIWIMIWNCCFPMASLVASFCLFPVFSKNNFTANKFS